MTRSAHGNIIIAALLLVMFLSSCGEDQQIRTYEVEKSAPKAITVAVISRQGELWFIKLTGPEPTLNQEEKHFLDLLQSLTFDPGKSKPVQWVKPAHWRDGAEQEMRVAAFDIPSPDGVKTECAISHLPENAGWMQPNVNRWRQQVGLPETTLANIKKNCERKTVAGLETWIFRISRSREDSSDENNHMHEHAGIDHGHDHVHSAPAVATTASTTESTTVPFSCQQPESWESQPASGMRVAAYKVKNAESPTEVTVIPLGTQIGSTADNVNRWRTQLDLPPLKDEELEKSLETVTIDGVKGTFVQLQSKDKTTGILAAILPRQDRIWFFKMSGAQGAVSREREAFVKFVQSVRFK